MNSKGESTVENDLLLVNGLLLTMNEKDEIVEEGQILIRNGEIIDIGKD